jgi:nucleotide-binding universal stress UspA family protein
MYREILLPADGSPGADVAVDHALDVAARFDATVDVLYVADTTRDSVTAVGHGVVDVLEAEGEGVVADTAERAASVASTTSSNGSSTATPARGS